MRRIRKCVQYIIDYCTCSTAAASFSKVITKTSFLQVSVSLNAGRCHCRQSKFVVYFSISSLQCHVVFVFLT